MIPVPRTNDNSKFIEPTDFQILKPGAVIIRKSG